MNKIKLSISFFLALTVTLLPLLAVTVAWANPLDDAQANLVAGQQELVSATQGKEDADNLVATTYGDLGVAQASVDAAQLDYDTNLIPQVTSGGSGLSVDIYNNTISRTPDPANLCRHDTVTQINANWGSGPVMGCNSDRVTVHYYGTLTVPTSGQYMFRNIADDGFFMTLDGQIVINDWRDKGCGGNWYYTQLQAGHTYALDAWYYENGGGACSTMYYQGNNNSGVVPAAWFGSTPVTTLVHDPAKLDALTAAQSALASAQTAYDAALAAQVVATLRLQAATDAIPALEQAVLDATPVVVPSPEPVTVPTPQVTETPQTPMPIVEPSTTPFPEPSTIPTASPEPQPSQPEPSATPVEPVIPVVQPVVDPPVVEPVPQPQPIPYPVVEPSPVPVEPAPVPVVTPEPVPTVEPAPSVQPTTAPQPSPSAVETPPPAPAPVVTASPATSPVPPVVAPVVPPVSPVVEPTKDVSNIATVDLKAIDPQSLTTAEVATLITAADVVLGTAAEGSPAYDKALQALGVAAQADDPQVPTAIADIPGVGQAAVAVLSTFNALGNLGSDMSPAKRKTAKKEVVAAIVLTQVTTAAVGAATSAASTTSSSAARRKDK